MSSDSSSSLSSRSPVLSEESRGSSVSTQLREEYEDLLRYAVVAPVINFSRPTASVALKKADRGGETQSHHRETVGSPSRPPGPEVNILGGSRPAQTIPSSQAPHLSYPSSNPYQPIVTTQTSQPAPTVLSSQAPHTLYPMTTNPYQSATAQTTTFSHPPPPFTAMSIQQQLQQQQQQQQQRMTSFTPSDQTLMSNDLRPHDSAGLDLNDGEDSSINLQGVVGDPEMTRLEGRLDTWCLDLKRNIMAEFEQARIRLLERQQEEFRKEREEKDYELARLKGELERFKELLVTYENSIGRKDHIVSNLTRAMQKQKEKLELQRTFGSWKLRHCDEKREAFASSLAKQHYNRKVKGHVWSAWHGILKMDWKQRAEAACQKKAEEVCMELTAEYEEKLAAMHNLLEEAQDEIRRLKGERDLYEENMKKAFMRGVCALNLEAMTMFKTHDDRENVNGDDEIPCCPSNDPTTAHLPPPPAKAFEGTAPQGSDNTGHMQNGLPSSLKRDQVGHMLENLTNRGVSFPTSSNAPSQITRNFMPSNLTGCRGRVTSRGFGESHSARGSGRGTDGYAQRGGRTRQTSGVVVQRHLQ